MTKLKTKFNKVIINVPINLLEDFDIATSRKNYSRSEGIKEAMRLFIDDLMGEDWVPPRLLEQSKEEAAAQWGGMMKGMLEEGQKFDRQLPQLPETESKSKRRVNKRVSKKK